MSTNKNDGWVSWVIGVLSVVIPIVVAILLFADFGLQGLDVTFLPHMIAVINTATFICLLIGYYFIKQHNIKMHRVMMFSAFVLSAIFLVSYVIFHSVIEESSYEGEYGFVYYPILISHILLSMSIVPLVLFSIYFAITNRIEKHKKWVKWTLPIWLYVAGSGVVTYFMIRPYYNF